MKAIVVFVTCPSGVASERLARVVVGEGLAACANVVPLRGSIFRWKGKMERARETLLIFKTTRSRFPALRRRVRALHSYEVPEIIAVPVVAGDPAYLRWVAGECQTK